MEDFKFESYRKLLINGVAVEIGVRYDNAKEFGFNVVKVGDSKIVSMMVAYRKTDEPEELEERVRLAIEAEFCFNFCYSARDSMKFEDWVAVVTGPARRMPIEEWKKSRYYLVRETLYPMLSITREEAIERWNLATEINGMTAVDIDLNEKAYTVELKSYGLTRLAEWGDWVRTGVNPDTKTLFSGRFENLREWAKDAEVMKRSEYEYAEALKDLKALAYTGPVIVLGFLSGNNWKEVVFGYESLEKAKGWLFENHKTYLAEFDNLKEAIEAFNESLPGPETPLRVSRKKEERVRMVMNILENERIVAGDEWVAFLGTIPELIMAIETGGNVPNFASAEANTERMMGEAAKLKAAVDVAFPERKEPVSKLLN